jgi:hypothetical protein
LGRRDRSTQIGSVETASESSRTPNGGQWGSDLKIFVARRLPKLPKSIRANVVLHQLTDLPDEFFGLLRQIRAAIIRPCIVLGALSDGYRTPRSASGTAPTPSRAHRKSARKAGAERRPSPPQKQRRTARQACSRSANALGFQAM